MYKYKRKIMLPDTDAAGILFFSNQLLLHHEALETFFDKINIGLDLIIRNKEYLLPVIHAESDHKSPLTLGDTVDIQIKITKIGKSSFSIKSLFFKNGQTLTGTAETVHVAIDFKTRKKILLPPEVLNKLKKFKG